MRRVFGVLLTIFSLGISHTSGQTKEDSVRAVVQQAIDGLAAADTTLLNRIFDPSANLVLVSYSGDSTVDRIIPIRMINSRLSRAGPRRRETLRNEKITVFSDLATVSAEYQFYYNDSLHHCGVTMYDLVRMQREWVIVQIRQTDHRIGCRP